MLTHKMSVSGDQVKCLTATDPDTHHALSYSIVTSSVQAYDENGKTVNVTSTGIKVGFAPRILL